MKDEPENSPAKRPRRAAARARKRRKKRYDEELWEDDTDAAADLDYREVHNYGWLQRVAQQVSDLGFMMLTNTGPKLVPSSLVPVNNN